MKWNLKTLNLVLMMPYLKLNAKISILRTSFNSICNELDTYLAELPKYILTIYKAHKNKVYYSILGSLYIIKWLPSQG